MGDAPAFAIALGQRLAARVRSLQAKLGELVASSSTIHEPVAAPPDGGS